MSVIAARVYPKSIVMAADNQGTWGHNKFADAMTKIQVNEVKIWQHNDLTIGGAGSAQEDVLFRVFTKTRKPKSATVEDMIDFMVEFADWMKKRDQNSKLENHYLIIFQEKLFSAVELDIAEVSEYFSVGSGMFLALGAMYRGASPEEAVEAAKTFDLYCGGQTYVKVIEKK